MKKLFLAFFDILGYKEFILKNDNEKLITRMGHIFRDIEMAQSKGKFQKPKGSYVLADLTDSRINSLNISDTIIFWTNDDSLQSLIELLDVSSAFNWRINRGNFPTRGAVLFGDARIVNGIQSTENGGTYTVSCLYGKGIVNAYLKAENQSWAGCVIDETVVEEISKYHDPATLLSKYAIKYLVPYKQVTSNAYYEFVMRLVPEGLKDEAGYNFVASQIECAFLNDNKSMENIRVKEIFDNTLTFIKAEWKDNTAANMA